MFNKKKIKNNNTNQKPEKSQKIKESNNSKKFQKLNSPDLSKLPLPEWSKYLLALFLFYIVTITEGFVKKPNLNYNGFVESLKPRMVAIHYPSANYSQEMLFNKFLKPFFEDQIQLLKLYVRTCVNTELQESLVYSKLRGGSRPIQFHQSSSSKPRPTKVRAKSHGVPSNEVLKYHKNIAGHDQQVQAVERLVEPTAENFYDFLEWQENRQNTIVLNQPVIIPDWLNEEYQSGVNCWTFPRIPASNEIANENRQDQLVSESVGSKESTVKEKIKKRRKDVLVLVKQYYERTLNIPWPSYLDNCEIEIGVAHYNKTVPITKDISLTTKTAKDYELTQSQKNILFGTALGDANIRPSGAFDLSMSIKSYDHLLRIQATFDPIINTGMKLRYHPNGSLSARVITVGTPYGKQLYKSLYPTINGRAVKRIPTNVAKFLSPESVAYLIMDDGGKSSDGYAMRIHTQGFPKENQEILSDALNSKFGFHTEVIPGPKPYHHIYFPSRDLPRLVNLIEKHVSDCFQYKLDFAFRNR